MSSTDTLRPILYKATTIKKEYLNKFKINRIIKIIQFKKYKGVCNSQYN